MASSAAAIALSPLAARALRSALCVAVTASRGFAWGARVGVFAFPLVQLAHRPGRARRRPPAR